MKIGFFKVIGLIGLLAEELGNAAKDGKITIAEAIHIVEAICSQLGIEFDNAGVNVDKE